LESIQLSFGGVGYLSKPGANFVEYRISSIKDIINVAIPFFDKYSLITQKKADYDLFKCIVKMVDSKEYSTPAGLQKIVNLRASMN
jgi:hypothetical protein